MKKIALALATVLLAAGAAQARPHPAPEAYLPVDAAAAAPYPEAARTVHKRHAWRRRNRSADRQAFPRRAAPRRVAEQGRGRAHEASRRAPISIEVGPNVCSHDELGGVQKARDYLATVVDSDGYTIHRMGVRKNLAMLHPEFAVRLAGAIKQARARGLDAKILSAYRPPAYGVGGYANKFNSMHAYGLAVDMSGWRACSAGAKEWKRIANANGLYLPYGPCNRAEYNHTQLLPEFGRQFVAGHRSLRRSITADGPILKLAMWAASGVSVVADKVTAVAESVPKFFSRDRRVRLRRHHPHSRRYARRHEWRRRRYAGA